MYLPIFYFTEKKIRIDNNFNKPIKNNNYNIIILFIINNVRIYLNL